MTTTCIIQARMGSERLPGKVLLPILGEPMLARVVDRVKRARLVDDVVIATTTHQRDDELVELCQSRNWRYFRGSESDVLDRYYRASTGADHIVRITSDCPVIDPTVIDYVIAAYHAAVPTVDYAANVLTRSYPRGLDIEVFSYTALSKAWHNDQNAGWREHVTPYLYRNPNLFKLLDVTNATDYSQYRLTVDTPQDFELVQRIYRHFGNDSFSWYQIITLLEQEPDWVEINREVIQKPVL